MSVVQGQDILTVGVEPLGIPNAGEDLFRDGQSVARKSAWKSPAASRSRSVALIDSQEWVAPEVTEDVVRGRSVHWGLTATVVPLIVGDLLALAACTVLSLLAVRILGWSASSAVGITGPLLVLAMVPAYWLGGLYPGIGLHPVVELRQFTKLNCIGFIAAVVGCYLSHAAPAYSIFFAVAWILALAAAPIARAVTRQICAKMDWWGVPTLVIACDQSAEAVVRMLEKHRSSGLRPVALYDPTCSWREGIGSVTAVSDHATVSHLIESEHVRCGIVSLPSFAREEALGLIERYRSRIARLIVTSNSELPSLWTAIRSYGAISGIEVQNGLMQPSRMALKRAMDLTLSIVGMIGIFPLLVLIAGLIKLSGNGRVFYCHTRIGRGGRPFKAWKFRSMRSDGDKILTAYLKAHPHAREEWERDHKLRNDPRVTWIGGFLRRSSLDELPQLWNVLKGEMSLVGPRPIISAEVDKYGDVFRLYKGVRPGLTGLWQVSGRNDTTYDERVRLDSFYVRNWSLWLDAYILAKTARVILRGHGAY